MVDVQTVSIAIASAGVFLAAVYYIFQLKPELWQILISVRSTVLDR
jgi:hypothetical protein